MEIKSWEDYLRKGCIIISFKASDRSLLPNGMLITSQIQPSPPSMTPWSGASGTCVEPTRDDVHIPKHFKYFLQVSKWKQIAIPDINLITSVDPALAAESEYYYWDVQITLNSPQLDLPAYISPTFQVLLFL